MEGRFFKVRVIKNLRLGKGVNVKKGIELRAINIIPYGYEGVLTVFYKDNWYVVDKKNFKKIKD